MLATWPAIGSGRPSVAADGRTVLVSDADVCRRPCSSTAGPGATSAEVQTCQGFVAAGSLKVRDGLAAFVDVLRPTAAA